MAVLHGRTIALRGLRELIDRSMSEVRLAAGMHHPELAHAAEILGDIEVVASIEVGDETGGLSLGAAQAMFEPFQQLGVDRAGLGLGLMISRPAIEANCGEISFRDLPGKGCIFAIEMPIAAAGEHRSRSTHRIGRQRKYLFGRSRLLCYWSVRDNLERLLLSPFT